MTNVIKMPTHICYITDGKKVVAPYTTDLLQEVLAKKEYSPTVGHLMKSGLYVVDILFDCETDEIIIFDYNGVPQRRLKK